MKFTYLLLNIASLSIPLLYSFHPKMNLIKWWKSIFLAMTITAVYFITWDYYFTKHGIWGFNDLYLTGVKIFNLPIEEWLFFWMIPYASLFIYFSLQFFKPHWKVSKLFTNIFVLFAIIFGLLTVYVYHDLWYTFINFSTFIIVLFLAWWKKKFILQRYLISYLIILIPFVLVNGLLTGMFTSEPVVWYNHAENMNIRFITIPLEDFIYSFTMLLSSLFIIDIINPIFWEKSK